MSVIYIDLGCSDGQTARDFILGKSFLPNLAPQCTSIYAFDPIRHEKWWPDKDGHFTFGEAHDLNHSKFFECAAGVQQGLVLLAVPDDDRLSTCCRVNKLYDASPFKRKVKMIDFTKWLRDHVQFEDTVIVRMDIMGAEYELLEALIKRGVAHYINYLFVNFNESTMPEKHIDRKKWILENWPGAIGGLL